MNNNLKALFIFIILSMFIFAIGGNVLAESYDLGGRTITYAYTHDLEARYWDEPQAQAYLEEIEEEFNVNIEFHTLDHGTASDDFIENLSAEVMAGDTSADVYLVLQGYPVLKQAQAGLIHPLDDFANYDEYGELNIGKEAFRNPTDGRVYAFNEQNALGGVIAWNKEMFEEYNLPTPYELMEEGEWNWENFKEIGNELRKDTSGDGEIDQYALTTNAKFAMIDIPAHFAAQNNAPAVRFEDGEINYNLDSPEVIETFEFIQELLDDGILEDHVFGYGSSGEFPENAGMNIINSYVQIDSDAPGGGFYDEAEVGLAPFPVGPSQEEYKPFSKLIMGWTIPVTEDNPREVVALTEALWRMTDEYKNNDTYPREVQNLEDMKDYYSEIVYDQKSLDILDDLAGELQPYTYHDYFIPGLEDGGEINNRLYQDLESPSSVVSEYKAARQERLDEIFNN